LSSGKLVLLPTSNTQRFSLKRFKKIGRTGRSSLWF